MYLPAEDSLSGLYSCYDDSSSPDGASSVLTRMWAGRNMPNERDRRRRLNEKLYAIRGVVPNITKVSAPVPACASSIYRSLQEEDLYMFIQLI